MNKLVIGLIVTISLVIVVLLNDLVVMRNHGVETPVVLEEAQIDYTEPDWVKYESHQWVDIAGPDKEPMFEREAKLLKPGLGFGWYARFHTSKDALFVEETIEMSGPSKWNFKKPSKQSNEYAEVINDGQLVRTKWIFPKSDDIRRGYIVSSDDASGPVKMTVHINGNFVGDFEWEIVK